MQSNKINIQVGAVVSMPTVGNGFWFESGTSTTSNSYILVKGEGGSAEVRLKPGQMFQITQEQGNWSIKAEDPTAVITGNVIVGDGDFNDNNTANLVTINASAIGNSQALPVQEQALSTITNFSPVTINTGAAQALVSDPTQRILRVLNTSATGHLYIGSSTVTTANAAIVLNPGDLWIESEGAGAAWFATSDAAGTIANIMGMKL